MNKILIEQSVVKELIEWVRLCADMGEFPEDYQPINKEMIEQMRLAIKTAESKVAWKSAGFVTSDKELAETAMKNLKEAASILASNRRYCDPSQLF